MSKYLSTLAAAFLLLAGIGCQKKTPSSNDNNVVEAAPDELPTVLVVEAEALKREGCFEVANATPETAGEYVKVPAKGICAVTHGSKENPLPKGTLTLEFELTEEMKLNYWVRSKWMGECSNSVLATLPNGMKRTVTSSTYKTWRWEPVAKNVPTSAGPNKLTIDAREFDVYLDQIMITSSDNPPQGIEKKPAETTQTLRLK